jgi:hypothetical protein
MGCSAIGHEHTILSSVSRTGATVDATSHVFDNADWLWRLVPTRKATAPTSDKAESPDHQLFRYGNPESMYLI